MHVNIQTLQYCCLEFPPAAGDGSVELAVNYAMRPRALDSFVSTSRSNNILKSKKQKKRFARKREAEREN